MPLYYQQDINETTKLAVWKIEETADFFLQKVKVHRAVTHPHKQLQHLAGRYLLTFLFPEFPSELIEIADTRKPFLPGDPFHFSISHCGNYAAAIVSTTERVGIDIEETTERVHKIKHKFLSVGERAIWGVDGIDFSPGQTGKLTLLWGAKEALYKWWGKGELDFIVNMQLLENTLWSDHGQTGVLRAHFVNDSINASLELSFILKNGLSLVWINTKAF